MAYKHIGKNFTPPDVRAKVTGKAKYAEDFRADGMVFIKLLTSPMPHAIVRNIDDSDALKMEGVVGILKADEVPNPPPPLMPILTNNPKYVGDPILAVAAVDVKEPKASPVRHSECIRTKTGSFNWPGLPFTRAICSEPSISFLYPIA